MLVVDDDEAIRETLRFALEDEGYAVEEAGDGATALALLQSSALRMVVLLDEIMPRLDGTAFLRRVAADEALATRHAYILVTATAHVQQLQERVAALGALTVPIVRKPFDIAELLDAVQLAASHLISSAEVGVDYDSPS